MVKQSYGQTLSKNHTLDISSTDQVSKLPHVDTMSNDRNKFMLFKTLFGPVEDDL